jgi:hypothetical protein
VSEEGWIFGKYPHQHGRRLQKRIGQSGIQARRLNCWIFALKIHQIQRTTLSLANLFYHADLVLPFNVGDRQTPQHSPRVARGQPQQTGQDV